MENRKLHFYIPIGVAVVATTAVLIGIFNFWFGTPRSEVMWFCERVRDGFVKQPANTWSNIGFILTGIYIGWLSYKNDFNADNWMTTTFFYPVLFASVVVFLGPGSMAMHATDGPWGGFLDLLSMFMIASFVFTYGLKRLFGLPVWGFSLLFIGLVSLSAWIFLQPWNITGGMLNISEYIFAGELLLAAPIELAIRYGRKTNSKVLRGWASALTMILAFVIWNLSRTSDSMFCNPDSLLQGHAIWHILNAASAFFLFMFYTSEHDSRVGHRVTLAG